MDIRDMYYVMALNKYENIGKAADEVLVSQPAISKFLKAKSDYYGERMFVKDGHKLRATAFGKLYISYAEKFIELEKQMEEDIDTYLNKRSLCIAIPGVTGQYVVSKVLREFSETHPDVHFRYKSVHSAAALPMLKQGEADIAVCNVPEDPEFFCWAENYTKETVLCVPKNHPAVALAEPRKGFSCPWIDLNLFKNEMFLLLEQDQWPRIAAERYFAQTGFSPAHVTIVEDIRVAGSLVSSGNGVSFFNHGYHFSFADPEKVTYLSCGTEPVMHESVVVWRRGRKMPEYFGELVSLIRKAFEEMLPNENVKHG